MEVVKHIIGRRGSVGDRGFRGCIGGVEGGWCGLLSCTYSLGFVRGSGVGMVGGILGNKKGGKIIDSRYLMHS